MDLTLIAELFDSLERLALLLSWEWAADPTQVGRSHRHLSHLYIAFPGATPPQVELRATVSATLDARDGDSTGWSLIRKMALQARLGQANKVEDLLRLLFRPVPEQPNRHRGGFYPSFFAAHPPFQIDANLGYLGALAETLVQIHADTLPLLPAVRPYLASETTPGLVARPGITVDLRWRDRQLTSVVLRAPRPTTRTVCWGDERLSVRLAAGQPFSVSLDRSSDACDAVPCS